MTVLEAIAYLKTLPPNSAAPISTQLKSETDPPPAIALGKVRIAIDPENKVGPGTFYIGQDAEITIDGAPLEMGAISEFRMVLAKNRPIILEIAVEPHALVAETPLVAA